MIVYRFLYILYCLFIYYWYILAVGKYGEGEVAFTYVIFHFQCIEKVVIMSGQLQ